jgi:type II secretory pathway pseudopilin PulG
MNLSRRFTRRRGFGLLEVIVVFALVIGAAAVVFTVFSSSSASAEAAGQSEAMNAVVANIRALHPNGDYSDLYDTAQANPKAYFPTSMIGADGVPHTPWSPIQVGPYYKNSRQFDVNQNFVPDDGAACAKYISAMGTVGFDEILVGGSSPTDMGGSVLTNGKLDMDKVNFWCSGNNTSDQTVGMDLIGH